MNAPIGLQAAALLFWGIAGGHGGVGILLAVARLVPAGIKGRLELSDRDLTRTVDITVAVGLIVVAGLLSSQGLPQGLLTATGWLPAILLPLILIDAVSASPLRLRHLALSMRRSARPEADSVVDPAPYYLALTLLATGISAKPSPWFFWALAAVFATWIFVAQAQPRLRLFVPAALIAVVSAFALGHGLQRTQLALQEWFIDSLAGIDSDPYQNQTRIGDLGRLKLSDRIVWRVDQLPPAKVPLLLRSGVFTQYNNGAWQARRDAFAPLPERSAEGPAKLILHGDSHNGTVLLALPMNAGRPAAPGRIERNGYGIIRVSDAPSLLDISVPVNDAIPSAPISEADLALPPHFDELFARLPEFTALSARDERERLSGLESWFARNFRYTLFVGDERSGKRDLERFLLTDRAGHCEYFATATVLLLRALGIPARYVTGYSVQEYARLERTFIVRQRHAHAWAEAFVKGRWIEVNTTPSTWAIAEEDNAPFWLPLSDTMSWAWRRFGELRRDLAAGVRTAPLAVGSLLLILTGGLFLFRRWRGVWTGQGSTSRGRKETVADLDAEMREFRALEDELKQLGLGRRADEPPRAWIVRAAGEGKAILDETRIAAARTLVEEFYKRRYGLGRS